MRVFGGSVPSLHLHIYASCGFSAIAEFLVCTQITRVRLNYSNQRQQVYTATGTNTCANRGIIKNTVWLDTLTNVVCVCVCDIFFAGAGIYSFAAVNAHKPTVHSAIRFRPC